MSEPSVYEIISREYARDPRLPYSFQNLALAGRREAELSLYGDEFPQAERERCAAAATAALRAALESGDVQPLTDFTANVPVVLYANALAQRARTMLDEGLLPEEETFHLAMKLAREGRDFGVVQLGIILLGWFENDLGRRVLRTLALHSAFTYYAVVAAREMRQGNRFLFDLAQNTAGFGRLVAACALQPLEEAQRDWLYEQALEGSAQRTALAAICIRKPDMAERFLAPPQSEEGFHLFSRWLAYLACVENFPHLPQAVPLAEIFTARLGAYPPAWAEVAAAAMLLRSLRANPSSDKDGWPMEWRDRIYSVCNEYLANLSRSPLLQSLQLDAMARGADDDALILEALNELNERKFLPPPDFPAFFPLIERDAFGAALLRYLLIRHPKRYAADVHAALTFPEEVFSGPELIEGDDLPEELHPDLWLQALLAAMRAADLRDEPLFLRSLSARWQGARDEAITCLRAVKLDWSEAVRPALAAALEAEPDERLQKKMRRLLWNEGGKRGAEQRYVDVGAWKLEPSPADETVLYTDIAGAFYRDMTVVRDRLESGDALRLSREPENPYDANAILVTTLDGYVLGYIPRAQNSGLAARMDAGERFYAVLCDSLEDGNTHPAIEVKRASARAARADGALSFLPQCMRISDGTLFLDFDDLTLKLTISDYVPPASRQGADRWCEVSLQLDTSSAYHRFEDVYLESGEVDALAAALEKLLRGEPVAEAVVRFREPGLELRLSPAPEPSLELALHIRAPEEHISDTSLALRMDAACVEALRAYLDFITRGA